MNAMTLRTLFTSAVFAFVANLGAVAGTRLGALALAYRLHKAVSWVHAKTGI